MKARVQRLLQIMGGDKLTRPVNAGAVKRYFVKIYKNQSNKKKSTKKLDKSQT